MDKEFPQESNTVYWLKIVALVDSAPGTPEDRLIQWGWLARDYTVPNPLASGLPEVDPGERIIGEVKDKFIPPTPVWHFQDDAVSGHVVVDFDGAMPTMPLVTQDTFQPLNYLPSDGPLETANLSMDLAFELYTTPEPSSGVLALLALVGCAVAARRRNVPSRRTACCGRR